MGSKPEPASKYVRLKALQLHYLEWEGVGPPLLFLHGVGFLGRLWEPYAASLSPQFRGIALDLRGHGDSDKPPFGYQWQDWVGDLKDFLDALGLRGCLAVGHSAGGTVAALCAAWHPGSIVAAVLIDPILMPPRPGSDEGSTLGERTQKRR